MSGHRLAADVGGTFTDVVLADEAGRLAISKVLSSPPSYEDAVMQAASQLTTAAACSPEAVMQVLHGTTAATNAVLERKGGPAGLITTAGFRDVLELRRLRMPELYNVFWTKPAPLVPRRHVAEVSERIGADGVVIRPLDMRSVQAATLSLVSAGVKSIAISLINSYRNPAHENEIAAYLRREHPEVAISVSHLVSPEIGEFERASTTVANAYLAPVMSRYITDLRSRLNYAGYGAPLMIAQSSGGMMTSQVAAQHPVASLESGPAAGVIAAQAVLASAGIQDAVTFDMGGTTAKASLITRGVPAEAAEYEVGAPVSAASRLLKGGGYLLRMRAVDVAEVGSGGGSLVTIDRGGSLRIGPESAGSAPGPICYGRGGETPTVTDANVALGYLNPERLLGGSLEIDRERAVGALASQTAKPLGLSVEATAYAIHVVANANMARAIRSVTTERGIDARGLHLLAFGGNGPVHAAALARSLDMQSVLVPPAAGVLSAVGLLAAPLEQRGARTVLTLTENLERPKLATLFSELEDEVMQVLEEEGISADTVAFRRSADMRFADQVHELSVEISDDMREPTALAEGFRRLHAETYGYTSEGPTLVVNLRVAAGHRLSPVASDLASISTAMPHTHDRRAYFGDEGWCTTPVISHRNLSRSINGPLIVEEYDSTTVVPPGCEASSDDRGNILLRWRS